MRAQIFMLLLFVSGCQKPATRSNDWISLFDGKSLNGWKASENPSTFTVTEGMIAVHGDRAHLFYIGPVRDHDFKNFEFKASVMTTPGSNSGMFFHTQYQQEGFPSKGYEIQVNATHTDWRKTASIYAIQDVRDAPHKDNEWFTQHITVQGSEITVRVNDQIVNQYTVPDEGSRLSSGTFALQGHDPQSRVFYKDIMVRPLPRLTAAVQADRSLVPPQRMGRLAHFSKKIHPLVKQSLPGRLINVLLSDRITCSFKKRKLWYKEQSSPPCCFRWL